MRRYKAKEISKNKKKNGYLEVALPVDKNKRIYRLVNRLVLITFKHVEKIEKMEAQVEKLRKALQELI